jgi:hypothetical protein
VEERNSGGCTFEGPAAFCGWHSVFTSGGNSIVYSDLTDVGARGGCDEGLTTGPSGQLSTDPEVALMSHEFFEAITDP